MAYEALNSLLQTLNQILKLSHHARIYREIISIHGEAAVLQLHLKNIPKDMEEQVREATVAMEEIIKYIFSESNPVYVGSMTPSHGLVDQLKEAAEHFMSTAGDVVHSFNSKRRRLCDISPSISSSSSLTTPTTGKDIVVGFDEDLKEIKNRLSIYHSHLQVLSVVGMGGTGKTTLAKLVYNDKLIVNNFDICAWVTVSKDYTVGSILLNLLASLERGIPVEGHGRRDVPVESLIRKYLEDRRFLVVLDDMCSERAWDDLKNVFPNTDLSSWIMLTMRLHDVAVYVDSSIPIHTLRLLDAHHSWNLLTKKVFGDESCPIELEDVGMKIVKNCGGLPLSIVLVAGILSKVPKTRHSWKQIAASHGSLETIISMSYNQLPYYMRACFLYMGGFPEDYEICISELIELWITEGFLECSTRSKSLKEEAEDVFDDLAKKSLVSVNKRKFDSKTKSCSLHDIVWNFCIRQAKQEKFLLSVMDYLPSPILRRHFLPRLLKNYSRISATWHDLDLKDSTQSSFTHSIICIPQRGYRCVNSINKFSSLRVFHVLRRNDKWEREPSHVFDWELCQVLDLVYLIYLASNIPTSIVPSAISKLQNLQTSIIYKYEVVLPVEIWMLRQLRHLMAFSFNSVPCPNGATLPLENLKTMSMVMDFVCSGIIVKMIPNIKKLGIRCQFNAGYHIHDLQEIELHNLGLYHLDNLRQLCHHLDNLGHLPRLEKLKLESHGRFSFGELIKELKFMGEEFSENFGNFTVRPFLNSIFPRSLEKLALCGLGLPWEDMRIIGSLPNLQVLKLKNHACSGKNWKTVEGEFGELRVLLIDESHLTHWKTHRTSFRKLEYLILLNCPCLHDIPSEVGDITTLKLIETGRTSLYSLSVKGIEERQKKSGNHSFEYRVKHY